MQFFNKISAVLPNELNRVGRSDDVVTGNVVLGTIMLKMLTTIYLCMLTAIVLAANNGVLSPWLSWLHSIPFGDKACHFFFVGVLSFLVCVTLISQRPRTGKLAIVAGTVVLLAALTSLEEMSQALLRHRQYSELDMLCNIAGTCVFGALSLFWPANGPLNRATR